jgi:hypothetical protein
VITPLQGRERTESQKDVDRARLCCPGERVDARLETRHVLRKLRCCPRRIDRLTKAIHVL